MRRTPRVCSVAVLSVALLAAAGLAGCAPSDPLERALAERARWDVAVLSWAMAEDGRITVSARVSGPVRSDLRQLTIRVDLLDGQDRRVGSSWQTLDLSSIQRGGPEDVFLRIDAPAEPVEGLVLDTVPQPGPEEIARMPELAAAG